jgi:hypothetical protein
MATPVSARGQSAFKWERRPPGGSQRRGRGRGSARHGLRIGRQRRTEREVRDVSGTSRVQSQLICSTLVHGSDAASGSDIAEDWLVTAGRGDGVTPVRENYLCCGRRAGRLIRRRRADDHVVFVCIFSSWLLSRCNCNAFRLRHAILGPSYAGDPGHGVKERRN